MNTQIILIKLFLLSFTLAYPRTPEAPSFNSIYINGTDNAVEYSMPGNYNVFFGGEFSFGADLGFQGVGAYSGFGAVYDGKGETITVVEE
jgi:hypothetical protein